jgi:hypothetical protein
MTGQAGCMFLQSKGRFTDPTVDQGSGSGELLEESSLLLPSHYERK